VPPPEPRRDKTWIDALVRAHRWRRLDSGQAKSLTDVAEQEGIPPAFGHERERSRRNSRSSGKSSPWRLGIQAPVADSPGERKEYP
jgi:hypothetical protein